MRTVVHRIPEARQNLRTLAIVGGGVLLAVAGVVVLLLGDVPRATPVDGDDPRWVGAAFLGVGAVMMWMGWGMRHHSGWAIAPEGVVLGDRTVPWDRIGWLGLVVDDRREDGRVRQRWQIALREDDHGHVSVSAATRPDPQRVADLSRAVAAAWLVGAPPASVPVVLAPPKDEPAMGTAELWSAWESIRDGRWAEIHDIGRLDGAVVMPEELHSAGLKHLDEVVGNPQATLARRRPARGRRWLKIGSVPVPLPRRSRRRDAR